MLKFNTQQKEAENQLLQHQNELKALQLIERDSQRIIFVFVTIFSVFCFLVILFLLFRQITYRNNFKKMALRDELTNSPNRRAILAIAQNRYTQCKDESSNLTVAMLDIDHFKKFNDTHGHDVGDSVLRIFSEACQASLRSHDRYGRFGGEEWLLVLPDAKESEVAIIFNRLRESLKDVQLQSGLSISITFSLGSAQLRGSDKSIDHLIKRADKNLYRAKNQGRDRYVISE